MRVEAKIDKILAQSSVRLSPQRPTPISSSKKMMASTEEKIVKNKKKF
jgi:hypothetical protein